MTQKYNIIRLRRGTAAEWAASEPQPGGEVLKLGEPGFEKDTYKLKIGDGVTPWNSLSYVEGGAGGSGGPLAYVYNSDFFTDSAPTTITSDLTSIPEWLSTYTTETSFTQDGETGYDFGFDNNGLWFTGDAQPIGESYPVRTNFDIGSELNCEIIYTVNYNEFCSDQGICFFLNNVAPQWSWGTDNSRIAIQTNCPQPAIYGRTTEVESNIELSDPNFYTFRINYIPSLSQVVVNIYQGESINGTLLGAYSINERLPQGTSYRIGFAADQDNPPTRSYFKNLSITYGPPITQLTVSGISNNVDFSGFFQNLIDDNKTSSIRITSVTNPNNFGILNAAVPTISESNFVFSVMGLATSSLSLINQNEYYINIDIINSGSGAINENSYLKVCSLELTGSQYYAGDPVTVYQANWQDHQVFDTIDTDIVLTRGSANYDGGGGLYNIALQSDYGDNGDAGPAGTEWNADGWDDLSNITTRSYTSLYYALNEQIGKEITNAKLVMHDTINDKYYKFDFTYWQPGGGQQVGPEYPIGGFQYTRTLLWVQPDPVLFIRPGNSENTVDNIDTGLTIKRKTSGGGGIFNAEIESGWDVSKSPEGTLWNIEGWDNLSNVASRDYRPFYAATGGQLGNMVITRQYVMKDTINNKYYKVQFSNWGGQGSFEYTRQEINGHCQGNIIFGDGTVQDTAYTLASVSGVASAAVDNALNTSLVSGNNIHLNYDGGTNSLTISSIPNVIPITFNTNITIDASEGDIFDITLTDNITLENPSNPTDGQTIRWRVLQDGNGNRSVSLGDKFVLPSSATSPLPWSTSPNKMDILAATYHAGRDKWDIVAFVPGY